MEKRQLIWDVYQTVTLFGIHVLWFIPALCIAKALSQIVVNKLGIKKGTAFSVIIFVIVALMGNYLSIEVMSESTVRLAVYYPLVTVLRALSMMCFVIAGSLFRLTAYPMLRNCRRWNLWCCVLICAVLMAFCALKNEAIDVRVLQMGNPILTFISSLSGCLLVVVLSMMTEKTIIAKRILCFYGRNSLFIMVIHQYLFVSRACEWFTQRLEIHSSALNIILTCMVSGMIAYAVSYLKRKLKYAKV